MILRDNLISKFLFLDIYQSLNSKKVARQSITTKLIGIEPVTVGTAKSKAAIQIT